MCGGGGGRVRACVCLVGRDRSQYKSKGYVVIDDDMRMNEMGRSRGWVWRIVIEKGNDGHWVGMCGTRNDNTVDGMALSSSEKIVWCA